ncbi:MAG: phospholipase [Paludibacteraceae bacterium]|nr:phospholipase [Paludibacteraceae bacterium]
MRTIVLLIVFVCLGGLILLLKKYTGKNARKNSEDSMPQKEPAKSESADGECCGAHEICEKTGKYNPQFKPDYYDDEELDAYKGVSPDDYSEEAVAEFDEVLMTMNEEDVAGWLRSLQLRGIELPYSVRDKAIMILNQNT